MSIQISALEELKLLEDSSDVFSMLMMFTMIDSDSIVKLFENRVDINKFDIEGLSREREELASLNVSKPKSLDTLVKDNSPSGGSLASALTGDKVEYKSVQEEVKEEKETTDEVQEDPYSLYDFPKQTIQGIIQYIGFRDLVNGSRYSLKLDRVRREKIDCDILRSSPDYVLKFCEDAIYEYDFISSLNRDYIESYRTNAEKCIEVYRLPVCRQLLKNKNYISLSDKVLQLNDKLIEYLSTYKTIYVGTKYMVNKVKNKEDLNKDRIL